MPRAKREISESCIYHVMLRGINQGQLFYDDDDKAAFLTRLERYKEACVFEVYAWSIMGNHVHLLIKTTTIDLGSIMKRLELSYSHFYNSKYDRSGYLFQDRYKSKPIDSDEYLLAALRYIHRNPLEIGKPVNYWTSLDAYMHESSILNSNFCLSLFSENISKARKFLKKFIEEENDNCVPYLYEEPRSHISDKQAVDIICSVATVKNPQELSELERSKLQKVIPSIKEAGVSIRQIARLSGLNRGIVERCK